VPDLRCDVEQMIISGDRVVSHLHFHGTFTGTFGKLKGKGQKIDFIATDIYEIGDGKIVANWHIEDNLTLMKQLGACKFITPGRPGVMRKSYKPRSLSEG
jgi:predicted ester cyclase